MRKFARILVAALLYYSGLVAFARWRIRRGSKRLIILNYHQASHGAIRKHMLYLRRHYRILHLDEALKELYAPASELDLRDQRTLLAITFDDGYQDNYTHAFPDARELQVPITIFLVPGYMESNAFFWWHEAPRMARLTKLALVTLDGQTYHPNQKGERRRLEHYIYKQLRFATAVAEREAFLERVRTVLDVASAPRELDEEDYLPLTWAQALKMHESGVVSFGGHTMHHPVLSYLADPAEVRAEVTVCRAVMEQQLEQPVPGFAYPIGGPEEMNADAVVAVKEAGYRWAVTTNKGMNTPTTDCFQLNRLLSNANRPWLLLAAETSGIWQILAPLWQPFIDKTKNI